VTAVARVLLNHVHRDESKIDWRVGIDGERIEVLATVSAFD